MRKNSRFWPIAAWVFPVLPALSFYWNRWDAFLNPYGAAMFFGFLGLFYFLNALILSTRIRYFDRLYGQGRVLSLHTKMAAAALILILVHRYLKLADGDIVPTTQIMVGKIALIALIAIMTVTVIFMVKNPLHRLTIFRRFGVLIRSHSNFDFSKMKILHILLPIAGLAVAAHVLLAASIAGFRVHMIIPAAYLLCALGLYIQFKVIRPAQLRKHRYTVSEIRQPGGNITEVRMTGDPLLFKAGQYAYWRFFSDAVGREEHAFTIISPPGDDEIGFCVEASGYYRSALHRVRVGEKATVDGPYGNFTLPDEESIPVLLIAADIGISRFLAMLQDMVINHSLRPATLIWAVKSRKDLVYDSEFLKLAKRLPSFRYKPVIERHVELRGDGTVADFESGFISKGLIRGLCPELKVDKTLVYISCSDPVRTNLNRIFKSIGVPGYRVIREDFNLE